MIVVSNLGGRPNCIKRASAWLGANVPHKWGRRQPLGLGVHGTAPDGGVWLRARDGAPEVSHTGASSSASSGGVGRHAEYDLVAAEHAACEERDCKGLHAFPSNITRDDPPITRDCPPSLLTLQGGSLTCGCTCAMRISSPDTCARTMRLGVSIRATICGITCSHVSMGTSLKPRCRLVATLGSSPYSNHTVSRRRMSCSADSLPRMLNTGGA